jgi:hypothetical protein
MFPGTTCPFLESSVVGYLAWPVRYLKTIVIQAPHFTTVVRAGELLAAAVYHVTAGML